MNFNGFGTLVIDVVDARICERSNSNAEKYSEVLDSCSRSTKLFNSSWSSLSSSDYVTKKKKYIIFCSVEKFSQEWEKVTVIIIEIIFSGNETSVVDLCINTMR